MNQKARLDTIIHFLNEHQNISVDEACKLLDASPATVRRDFKLLSANGEVEKNWGGISRKIDYPSDMKPLTYRSTHFIEEKKAIARKASDLVQDGEVVMIDGGTTTLELSKILAHKKIRIITNSLLIVNNIHIERNGWEGAEVFLTGGFLYPDSGMLVGPEANKNLMGYHADWAFLSAGGINESGLTNSNQLVVETERTMIEQAEKTIVLADYSKIGIKSMCQVCGFDKIDRLVTNDKLEDEHFALLQANGLDEQNIILV